MSVIVSRAIPDACDGCKPVQRRILYAMMEGGFLWDRPYKKSAKIVGDVLGKYHPHGEGAIYDALVRMAQDFSMSMKLIDGQGNFGSIDGDPAASMRYTEARLAKLSKYILQDHEKDCVDMVMNYDSSVEIPSVLPASFPNLLVNGANGIAVGMATSIPTHNLSEVIDATCAFIDNRDISLPELLQYLKGPDFPTGGVISDDGSIFKIYSEGRGSVILRGIAEIEKDDIVITAIPYQVNKSRLIEQIADLAQDGTLEDVTNVRDESNLDGIRIVVESKRGTNVEILRRNLFVKTLLQTSVHAHMLALDNGIPRQLNLRDMLEVFVNFRDKVIIRRTDYFMKNAKARVHILCGQLLALEELDQIIACIRKAGNPEQARERLAQIRWDRKCIQEYMKLDDTINPNLDYVTLSEVQIKSIMEMRLQSLTNLERDKVTNELADLENKMRQLQVLLDSQDARFNTMKDELALIKGEFGIPRRTEIERFYEIEGDLHLVQQEECVITVSHRGYVKRVSLEQYRTQHRGGRGKQGATEADPIEHFIVGNTHASAILFSTHGYAYALPVYKIPEATPNTIGRSLKNIIEFRSQDERIMAALAVTSVENDFTLVFVTSKGYVRRNAIADFLGIRRNGKLAIDLESGETLASVVIAAPDSELLITSSDGKSARIAVSALRIFSSRSSRGVIGMSVKEGESIVSVTLIEPGSDVQILTVTARGFGKRAFVSKYRATSRGAKGVSTTVVSKDTGPVVGAYRVSENDELLLMNTRGQIIRCSVNEVRVTDRMAKGVYLAKLDPGDHIAHVFIIQELT